MSHLILSADTTSEFGSLALARDAAVVEEVLLHAPEGFSGVLYEQIRRLLERHDARVDTIGGFAAAAGPGSFTGVRIGLACLKGLAEAAGARMVALSNLEVLAAFGSTPLRAVVIDARRGEVYCALYDREGKAVIEETVLPFPAFLERLPPGEVEFLSTDFTPYQAALAGTRFAACRITTAPRALAGAMCRIAHERFRAGLAQDPAEIDANYVRRPDAELFSRSP